METLTMNNGVVLENSNAYESGGWLFVYIKSGAGLKDVFDLFIEPENTIKIIRTAPGLETEFDGYNFLISVKYESEGFITASLIKKDGAENGEN